MFSPEDACSNVHSQCRRMIMVSPEPDFWIHAVSAPFLVFEAQAYSFGRIHQGIEIAKTPKLPVDKAKVKGKEKAKGKEVEDVAYDYHEGSVHDLALRADIMQGYEQFKVSVVVVVDLCCSEQRT